MLDTMRAILSEAGSSVDPGPFRALINDAGMKKTELVKLWTDGEDKYNTAAAKLVALEAKVDHLEVQLTLERARAVASTRELLELEGVVRVKDQQLGEAVPARTGRGCRSEEELERYDFLCRCYVNAMECEVL
ncbi:hypothetical protein A4X09_0g5660 [Tilletia walkeri]|uniref:Uncharacterized protein n=1 Tax=Tilletia walkeri TaxID=117179 RepID=A0A8X7T342_9BASI|nr:hypothetical protein A4X09_0g5660 [Tilletia walkeri]